MNTMYKKIVAIIFITSSSVVIAKNNGTNMSPKDKTIALQFAPVTPAPFSQDKDDQYLAGLLSKIIEINEENYNNPHLKNTQSMTSLITQNQKNHIIFSKKASFGWNDPLAIVSALFYNGAAETPNDLIVKIEESTEYPEKYKAILKGRGLYSDNKTAHSQLTDYIKIGPTYISKYARLEDITTIKDLYDPITNSFKNSEKDQLKKYTPSIQGEVTCNCYFHGCDLNGVIYFDELTLAYLIQQKNGNRHRNNTVQRTEPMINIVKPVQAQETVTPKSQTESVPAVPKKSTLDQKLSRATSDTISDQEKELLAAMAEEDDDDLETDEDSDLEDDKE